VFLPLAYVGKSSNAIDEATQLRRALVQTTAAAQTRVIGEPAIWSNFQEVSKQQLARGETLGFPLILLILLAGFGTLVAAAAREAKGMGLAEWRAAMVRAAPPVCSESSSVEQTSSNGSALPSPKPATAGPRWRWSPARRESARPGWSRS